MRAVVCVALALVLLAPSVDAGGEVPTSLATAENTQRKLARVGDTLYAAVTVDTGGVPQVRVLSTRDGASWTTLPSAAVGTEPSDRATLAADSRGRLHLAWTEGESYERQVYYARFTSGAWGGEAQLSHSTGYAGFPSIAVDATDRVHVVWYGFDGQAYQVYYRSLEAAGWTEERALTNEFVDANNPAVALGPDGDVHVTWFRESPSRTSLQIAYLRVEGDIILERRTLSGAGDAFDPTIAVNASGRVHVAWTEQEPGISRLRHVAWGPGGNVSEVVTPDAEGAGHPSLALGVDDRAFLAYAASDGAVYVRSRNASWSDPVRLSAGGTNRYPSARWSQDHNPLCTPGSGIDVVWTVEEGGANRVGYARVIDPAGCAGPEAPSLASAVIAFSLGSLIVGIVVVLAAGRLRRRRVTSSGSAPSRGPPKAAGPPR